jgi:hypothetical protein
VAVRGTDKAGAQAMGNVTFDTDITGHSVVDSSGATIGTVAGVTTKGNGSVRTVQVTLTNGQIITLAPNSLSLNGDVLTTTSTTTNVNSQGAAHANINGLIHASPNSALASAGVTSLTGLDTGLTVNTSDGTLVGTVDSVVTNRRGRGGRDPSPPRRRRNGHDSGDDPVDERHHRGHQLDPVLTGSWLTLTGPGGS